MPIIKYIGKTDKFTGKTLFEILCNLKNFGIGRMVTRNSLDKNYPEPTFYIVKKVLPQMDTDLKFGFVWADVVFRGNKMGMRQVGAPYRPDYRLIPKEEEETYARWNEVEEVKRKVLPRYRPVPPLMQMIVDQQRKLKGEPVVENLRIESVYLKDDNALYQIADEDDNSEVKFEKVKINPQFLEGVKEI